MKRRALSIVAAATLTLGSAATTLAAPPSNAPACGYENIQYFGVTFGWAVHYVKSNGEWDGGIGPTLPQSFCFPYLEQRGS